MLWRTNINFHLVTRLFLSIHCIFTGNVEVFRVKCKKWDWEDKATCPTGLVGAGGGQAKPVCINGDCRCNGKFYDYRSCYASVSRCKIKLYGLHYECSPGEIYNRKEFHVISTNHAQGIIYLRENVLGLNNEYKVCTPLVLVLISMGSVEWTVNSTKFAIPEIYTFAYSGRATVKVANNSVSLLKIKDKRLSWRFFPGYGDDESSGNTADTLIEVYRTFGALTSFTGASDTLKWNIRVGWCSPLDLRYNDVGTRCPHNKPIPCNSRYGCYSEAERCDDKVDCKGGSSDEEDCYSYDPNQETGSSKGQQSSFPEYLAYLIPVLVAVVVLGIIGIIIWRTVRAYRSDSTPYDFPNSGDWQVRQTAMIPSAGHYSHPSERRVTEPAVTSHSSNHSDRYQNAAFIAASPPSAPVREVSVTSRSEFVAPDAAMAAPPPYVEALDPKYDALVTVSSDLRLPSRTSSQNTQHNSDELPSYDEALDLQRAQFV